MATPELEALFLRLNKVKPDAEYYSFTRTANDDGVVLTESLTNFAGFPDDKYHANREIRIPALVIPEKMIDLWKLLKQNHVVVNNHVDLYVYLRIGGNALLEESVAREWVPEWVEPREHVRTGYGGWIPVNALSEQAFKHAPTPKLRMVILKRDKFRCRLCGRSPDNHVDVELHVHHVRPFGKPTDGVTHEANLITLCHTCHKGLEPHYDDSLFDFIGSGMNDMIRSLKDGHAEGVERYRNAIHQAFGKIDKSGDCP